MTTPAIGFDSIKLDLGGFSSKFEGLLGVGIKVNDEEKFTQKYIETMNNLFEKWNIVCPRLVNKSADLAKFLINVDDMINFLLELFVEIQEEIEEIQIYCTRFNTQKLPQITIFGADKPEYVKPVQFVRLMSNGYPHVCAWSYLTNSNDVESNIYLDKFESYITPAWDHISKNPNLKVFYKGDNCNCLLSSSDLFIRLTTLLLKKNRANFNWKGLMALHKYFDWKQKVTSHTLGGQTKILRNITPYSKKEINLSSFINHPIVFIPQENPADWTSKEERKLFEEMPIYNDLVNYLFHIGGSFKYFTTKDIKLAEAGDYMLVMGENGDRIFNYLVAGGVPVEKITLKEIQQLNDKNKDS